MKKVLWSREIAAAFEPKNGLVNARVGPALLPVVQIRLLLFQALEALPLQRCFLGMSDARFDLGLGADCRMHRVRTVRRSDSV